MSTGMLRRLTNCRLQYYYYYYYYYLQVLIKSSQLTTYLRKLVSVQPMLVYHQLYSQLSLLHHLCVVPVQVMPPFF